MNTYETLFIATPELTEDEEQTVVSSFASIVTDGGGTMIANDRMGRRRLAYPIAKHEEGIYTRFLYDSDTGVPLEIERRLRLSDKVLRSLTVRLRKEWAEAAKKQAVLDEERRIQAEADAKAKAEEEAAAAAAAAANPEAAAPGEPAASEGTQGDATAEGGGEEAAD